VLHRQTKDGLETGVRSFAEGFSRQLSGSAQIHGNRRKPLCDPLAWHHWTARSDCIRRFCFRIVQLKNENSDSPRDLGQMTSDFERSWGRAHAPEYWLVDLNPYQL